MPSDNPKKGILVPIRQQPAGNEDRYKWSCVRLKDIVFKTRPIMAGFDCPNSKADIESNISIEN